jgi:hypothetical protein
MALGTVSAVLATFLDTAERIDECSGELLAQPAHIQIADQIGADLERIDVSRQGAQLGAVRIRRTAEHRNHRRASGRHGQSLAAGRSFMELTIFC